MSSRSRPGLGSLRKRLSSRKVKDKEEENATEAPPSPGKTRRAHSQKPISPTKSPPKGVRRSVSVDSNEKEDPTANGDDRRSRPNVFQRLRDRSRSRSRSRSKNRSKGADEKQIKGKEMLVAVTSCRSDGYYNQRAPGSTSKLPRKAPTNLKLFHELAVGVKDAYAAVGAVPRKPTEDDKAKMEASEYEAHMTLWNFIGNLDFVSSDSARALYQMFVSLLTDTTTSLTIIPASCSRGRSFG